MAYGLGAQPIASYAYGHDVGQDSDNAIIAFAQSSGFPVNVSAIAPDKSPPHTDDGGYHSTHNAVDFAGSLSVMDEFAAWAIKFAPYILELIHASNSAPGGGYFVHNGQVVGSSVYSAVLADHYNHVHLAMTPSGVTGAEHGAPILGAASSLVSNPVSDLSDFVNAIKKGAGFFQLISDPYTYKRLAFGIGGMILVAVGFMIIVDTRNLGRVKEALGIPTRQSVSRAATRPSRTTRKRSSSSSDSGASQSTAQPKSIPQTGKTFEYPNKAPKLGQSQEYRPSTAAQLEGKYIRPTPKSPFGDNPKSMDFKGLKNV